MSRLMVLDLPIFLVDAEASSATADYDPALVDDMSRYCHHFEPLPAVRIAVERSTVRLVSGHIYLNVARRIGRRRLRAVVTAESDSDGVAGLLARSDTHIVDWEEELKRQHSEPAKTGWFVIRTERPLDVDEKARFEQDVIGFWPNLWSEVAARPFVGDSIQQVLYDDAERFVEFEVWIPRGEAWFPAWIAALRRFSSDVCGISTFQGAPFDPDRPKV